MRVSVLLAVLNVSLALGAYDYGCTNVVHFQEANRHRFLDDFLGSVDSDSLKKYLEGESASVIRGKSEGRKMHIGSSEEFYIMIHRPYLAEDHIALMRHFYWIKFLCDVRTGKYLDVMIDCEMSAITVFYGCVQFNNQAFTFHKEYTFNFESLETLNEYRDMNIVFRVVVIMNVLDKLVDLHDRGIIHSNIMPANIISLDNLFSKIRLLNFMYAGVINSKFLGGTNFFMPPEVFDTKQERILTPQIDIYSMAMTIVFLEVDIYDGYKKLSMRCFKEDFTLECHRELMKLIEEAFKDREDFAPMLKELFRALSYNPEHRHQSAKDFSISILKVFKTKLESTFYFHQLAVELKPKPWLILKPSSLYTWMGFAKESGFVVELKEDEKSTCGTFCRSIYNKMFGWIQRARDEKANRNLLVEQQKLDQQYNERKEKQPLQLLEIQLRIFYMEPLEVDIKYSHLVHELDIKKKKK